MSRSVTNGAAVVCRSCQTLDPEEIAAKYACLCSFILPPTKSRPSNTVVLREHHCRVGPSRCMRVASHRSGGHDKPFGNVGVNAGWLPEQAIRVDFGWREHFTLRQARAVVSLWAPPQERRRVRSARGHNGTVSVTQVALPCHEQFTAVGHVA